MRAYPNASVSTASKYRTPLYRLSRLRITCERRPYASTCSVVSATRSHGRRARLMTGPPKLNPVDILVAVTPRGRGIVGVVDGQAPLGVETDRDVADRHDLLRAIGY